MNTTEPPQLPVPGLLIDQEFWDIESLNGVLGWDLDWRQIEPGPLLFRITAFGHTDISVMRVEFNRSFHQIGSPPPGAITLGLPDIESGILKWSGTDVSPGTLINFNYGKELDTVNSGAFGGYVISFSANSLDQTLVKEINQSRFWNSSGGENEQLRQILNALKEVARVEGSDGLSRWGAVFNQDVPVIIANIIASESHQPTLSAPKFQAHALERALAIISEYDQMPASVKAWSTLSGASWSTLQRAFLNEFGIVPQAYMKARRMAAVQAELIKQGPAATIHKVAGKWGFQHMGSFAADYKKQFGELPSETLDRTARPDS